MKSLDRKFNSIKNKNLNNSSFINFVKTIKNANFNKRIINYWFSKLVDKNDYGKKDKKQILSFLYSATLSK